MKLMTKAIAAALPPIYTQETLGEEANVVVKFFCPWNQWTWYASEAMTVFGDEETEAPMSEWREGHDVLCFGVVVGFERELGYWRLSELEGVRGPMGLRIERDLHWTPRPLRECK